MSVDKSMLDHLMAMPRKELVDDVIFYHDGWIAAGRECNELKAENAKLRDDLETQREVATDNTRRNMREYKRVRDENEKLRKKINALKAHGIEIVDAVAGGYEIYDTSQREVDRLEVENDKLREALRAAWKCAHAGISCSDCRLIAGGCTLQSAMQELGIEVK